ncbi:TetR/AcrR family transcriptional regulator [Chryseobacterium sp. CH21]|uniref:TetR/AcrR family transcriptional regulator n=1 Tax=Chryseobacterium sp. CH21 TaxID=713556 RepID=UPI001E28A532|nr:TetR/AcrR family transcriptional regulator [Chryseobacterium sp. CH21]
MAKGEETRQFIIEKAAPIFNTKGIAATSMSDIMEATKLSKGSMYVHFENKDVLACAAVEHNMKILSEKLQRALIQYKTSKEQLFAYIDFLVILTILQ